LRQLVVVIENHCASYVFGACGAPRTNTGREVIRCRAGELAGHQKTAPEL